MTATVLAMLSKFMVFMSKLMTAMLKTWRQTFTATKSTWQQIANQLYGFIHYGMHNMLASLR
ncbi:hypothetical protein [Candidatus Albibeggiatoa sp. nov. NOAA]|uniref:hypothetical protein n=1 Tax=Candidatus Albibeggiatoa sp. nov. NOAA TaxID=3162724 RepID=UPI0032F6FA76|nr:hypothetical protein [Thiotrichaceae bacterium]